MNQVFYLHKRCSVEKISEFVQLNSMYKSDIYIKKMDSSYNSKCVLGAVNVLFKLDVGDQFSIDVNGVDAEIAMERILGFFEKSNEISTISTISLKKSMSM